MRKPLRHFDENLLTRSLRPRVRQADTKRRAGWREQDQRRRGDVRIRSELPGPRAAPACGCSLCRVSAAWFGLIGVVVGGLLSTIANLFSAVRQELNDAVVAARIIYSDLESDERSAADGERRSELWATHRADLARALGYKQWMAVAAAYQTNDLTPSVRGEIISNAMDMLRPVVASKRRIVFQRFGNFSGH
jgi:hypothetical protein